MSRAPRGASQDTLLDLAISSLMLVIAMRTYKHDSPEGKKAVEMFVTDMRNIVGDNIDYDVIAVPPQGRRTS